MANERLSMRKTREILRLKWELGRSHRDVAGSLGVGLGTVSLALERASGARKSRLDARACVCADLSRGGPGFSPFRHQKSCLRSIVQRM